MSDEVVPVPEPAPPVPVVVPSDEARGDIAVQPEQDGTIIAVAEPGTEIVTIIEEGGPPGPRGPQGEVGPVGPTGQGVLVLEVWEPIPPDTPDNTVVFRKEAG